MPAIENCRCRPQLIKQSSACHTALALSIAIGMASSAFGQMVPSPLPASRFYVGGEAGWTQLTRVTVSGHGAVAQQTFRSGFNAGVRAGYEWAPWRFEGEFLYRHNDLRNITRRSPSKINPVASGAWHTFAEMANVIYDFNLGWPITPHVGGGIGAAEVVQNLNPANGSGIGSTDLVFAYQGLAGLRYLISQALSFDIDYRYFATTAPTFMSATGVAIKSDYRTHNVIVSLTYLLGPPP